MSRVFVTWKTVVAQLNNTTVEANMFTEGNWPVDETTIMSIKHEAVKHLQNGVGAHMLKTGAGVLRADPNGIVILSIAPAADFVPEPSERTA